MGSSPLTRGKRYPRRNRRRTQGLIPAHAGKTCCSPSPEKLRAAHPRSRGENCITLFTRGMLGGSSPLTRGKHHCRPDWRARPRLIPAHAGKTAGGGASTASRGSSPLTRGKPVRRGRVGGLCGLIPAHAGKTMAIPPSGRRKWAHPRSRGENSGQMTSAVMRNGSSPLTRGKRCRALYPFARSGLIPAHAGKTSRCCSCARRLQAHPRSRGENL